MEKEQKHLAVLKTIKEMALILIPLAYLLFFLVLNLKKLKGGLLYDL
ncbi:hypothetical protein [Photorhabdus sp. RM323S]